MRRVALMVLGILVAGLLLAAPASAVTVTSWSALQSAMAAGGTVTLGSNITAPSGGYLDVSGVSATLNLFGHRLTISSPPAAEAAIHVPMGASLTVMDTAGTGLLTVTGGSGATPAIGADYVAGSASNGLITFAAGSHTIVKAGSGGSTIGSSGAFANARWTNAGVLTLDGGTAMDGQSNDGLINTGTIYVNGNMWGAGTLTNDGVIVVGPTAYITTNYVWIGNYYRISYKINYGAGNSPAGQTIYGPTLASTEQSLPAAGTRTGYAFAGWFTAKAGGTRVSNGSALKTLFNPVSQTPTFYAHWTRLRETVSFSVGSGSPVGPQQVYYGNAVSLSASPTRSGYNFLGWSTSPTGKPFYSFTAPVTRPVTLYAVWARIPVVNPLLPLGTPSSTPTNPQPSVSPLVPPFGNPSPPVHQAKKSKAKRHPKLTPKPSPSPSPSPTPTPLPNGSSGGGSASKGNAGNAHHPSGWTKPSSLSRSIPSIYDVVTHPGAIGLAIASGLVWTLLLMLVTSSLDKVISSNYDTWLIAFRNKFPGASMVFRRVFGFGHDRTWVAIVAVLISDAVVLDFVDPHFRPDVTSMRLLMSSMTAVFVETFIPCFLIIKIAKTRYGTAGRLRATPFGLIIGAAGVLLSRILGFLPGLLGGSTMTYDEPEYKTGERVWLAKVRVGLVLIAAGLCWVALSLIPGHGSMGELFLHDAAVIGAAAAITGTVLDLVPFAVFGGSLLFHHARKAWALYMAISAIAFFLLVVPQPRYWIFVGSKVLGWMIIAIVVIFAAVSILAFLQWKRGRAAEAEPA